MLVRGCHAFYVLAELFCVLGLLVLSVLKVQHFLSQPVSTAVSYQRSRPPAITICHRLTDEQAVSELQAQSRSSYEQLLGDNWNAQWNLEDAIESVSSYLRNYSQQVNQRSAFSDGGSPRSEITPVLNATKNKLWEVLNRTEGLYEKQVNADQIFKYPGWNDTKLLLRDVLNTSIVIMEQTLSAIEQLDVHFLNSSRHNLERLINITDDIHTRLRTAFGREPLPVRLLVEGTRRVDQFVISCLRGNVSCMPGEGGVWQLRHVLETDEKCYTLLAPEEDVNGEEATVVLELRGNKWKQEMSTEAYDGSTVPPEDLSETGDNTNATTIETSTEVTTVPEEKTTTETAVTTTKPAAEIVPPLTTTDDSLLEEDSSTLEPTFYPDADYNISSPFSHLNQGMHEEQPLIMLRPDCPPLFVRQMTFISPPVYLKSLNPSIGTPDSIQYVTYKVLLHATPVPLLGAHDGFRERSFEIFNNQDWVEVDVRTEELRSLDRDSRPCQQDPAYSRGSCLLDCQAAAHARAAGCQLEAVWPATDQGLPECQSAVQLQRLRAKLETPASCACPRPCRQGRVSAVVQASSRSDSDRAVTVTVRVDGDMQVIEESIAYTAGSMLTDFGGNLGLTMGFSLLTIVELLKKITLGALKRKREPAIPHENPEESDEHTDSMV